MPLVRVEPSGCCERKGMIQVRLCFYLEPGDYGYERHHIKVGGNWQTNPFHNHFIRVEPETTDKEIMDIAEAFLCEAFTKWALDLDLASIEHQPRNDALPFKKPVVVDAARIKSCEDRIKSVKAITTERKV